MSVKQTPYVYKWHCLRCGTETDAPGFGCEQCQVNLMVGLVDLDMNRPDKRDDAVITDID